MKVLVYDAYASRDKKTTTYLDVLVEQGIPDYKTYSCRREYLTTNTNLHPIATKNTSFAI